MKVMSKALVFLSLGLFFSPWPCVHAQTEAGQPLFTYFPTMMLCADTGFVALASVHPLELTVIRISEKGIEEPQGIPLTYEDVYGMKCGPGRVELLSRISGSDHFSRLLFTIGEKSIQPGNPQDIMYSISAKLATPPEIEDFHEIPLRLKRTTGDWRVRIFGGPPNRYFELHFVKTETRSSRGLNTHFAVDLLEKTFDQKVVRSLALIRDDHLEPRD